MSHRLEIIGFTIQGCIKAQQAGAHRIELCASPGEGGTTPSPGFIKAARKALSIPLYVMIRPRGGDFLYSDDEHQIMMSDVLFCKEAGCDGIVTGILNEDGKVDKIRCASLLESAYPMEATFHRAFDRTADPFIAMEDIIDVGFDRILTSGCRPKAIEALEMISQLINKAEDRIIIMPGSGINAQNIIEIAKATGAKEFHSSASCFINSKMIYQNNYMNEELKTIDVDFDEVQKMEANISKL